MSNNIDRILSGECIKNVLEKFNSIRSDYGPPDEEHDGVAFWMDGDDFHVEFPNQEGDIEGLYISPDYIEHIGTNNRIKKTYDINNSLARPVQQLMSDLDVDKKVKDKLNLIFLRIIKER